MFKLITRLLSNNTKLQPSEKESFIRFTVEGRVNENLLPKLIPWILSVSIAGGIYGISNVLPSSSSEAINDSNQVDSVE